MYNGDIWSKAFYYKVTAKVKELREGEFVSSRCYYTFSRLAENFDRLKISMNRGEIFIAKENCVRSMLIFGVYRLTNW